MALSHQVVEPFPPESVAAHAMPVLPKLGPGVLGRKGLLDPRKPQIFKPRQPKTHR